MAFEVKIIADSTTENGRRLTTLTATYPRIIHSEILTHRDRARNSASSRAIPFPTMCERIEADPFIPMKWGMEQSGMQTGDEIPEALRPLAKAIWLNAQVMSMWHANQLHYLEDTAYQMCVDGTIHLGATLDRPYCLNPTERRMIVEYIQSRYQPDEDPKLKETGVRIHKSIPNRIVEPWMWITVVMTATEWNNFFRLRCHGDAEIHFQKIAGMMRDAINESTPIFRSWSWDAENELNRWHLPFITEEDIAAVKEQYGHKTPTEQVRLLCEVSTARNARVSYLTHEGKRSIDADLTLYERLNKGSGFGHFSPYEHVAFPHKSKHFISGPFRGWCQFRKMFPAENLPG